MSRLLMTAAVLVLVACGGKDDGVWQPAPRRVDRSRATPRTARQPEEEDICKLVWRWATRSTETLCLTQGLWDEEGWYESGDLIVVEGIDDECMEYDNVYFTEYSVICATEWEWGNCSFLYVPADDDSIRSCPMYKRGLNGN